ncbi:hypothetical protein BDN67DRAFT_1016483 [Paxillus ammoniavirescens]|nr:hypothetical protein BDN67DRAFT_1016483 [Paxillus ammoniavirescens]
MGRPRTYKSQEAKLEAAWENHCRYYAKHKAKINTKCCQPCQAGATSQEAAGSGTALEDKTDYEPTTLADCLAIVKDAKDKVVALINIPQAFTHRILNDYIVSMPMDGDEEGEGSGDLEIIERAIAAVEVIHAKGHKGTDSLYQMCSVCPEWHACEQVCQFIQVTVAMFKDILCLAMEGESSLAEAHFLGKLMYQTHQ